MKKLLLRFVIALWATGAGLFSPAVQGASREITRDVVIYGGTSAGIMAAVQAVAMGKTVVLIEPTQHLGGMSTGGLGTTDVGREAAIGGLALQFYRRIASKYKEDGRWTVQSRSEYFPLLSKARTDDPNIMWDFEPKVALEVFADLIRENDIEVRRSERLKREGGVRVIHHRIVQITMESGLTVRGKMFIDASYEGDLMAESGVSYTIGREARSHYGESLNGVNSDRTYPHQRPDKIDAYVIPGDSSSGLLPSVKPWIAAEGIADNKVMAYCYRMCLTNAPENRVAVAKPAGYDEAEYELLLRSIEAGRHSKFFSFNPIPNRKTDTNSTEPFSTNFVGRNYRYPDGDYATRQRILDHHKRYQLGLLWTLQNHPRVPEAVRSAMREWGLPKDEFVENGNWSPQLYIREGRRMVGSMVMLQQHCERRQDAPEPVGMGSYTIDSHYVQRFVDAEGKVQHEGNVDRRIGPYGISYQALIPNRRECQNLLVPVCLSASHIAYGSIRMEPVLMILGQSAAAAACLAIDEELPVQDVNYSKLRQRLLSDGQVLELTGSE